MQPLRRKDGRFAAPVVIGLVNNMPGAAHAQAERQFGALLAEASGDIPVTIRFFHAEPPTETGLERSVCGQPYAGLDALETAKVDGLIVTGTPPRAAALVDEPFWPHLTRLADITQARRISTVWSCLAAHAAVLHLDGIDRRRMAEKASGVFNCYVAGPAHPVLAGLPQHWQAPHSRYNDLPTHTLVERGYQLLSVADGVGADIFVKQSAAFALFLQGHPEYDRETLYSEYRRDVGRFLAGRQDAYPEMPTGYFDFPAMVTFLAFRSRAVAARDARLLAEFPPFPAGDGAPSLWRKPAVGVFSNWLSFLSEQGWPRSEDRMTETAATVSVGQ